MAPDPQGFRVDVDPEKVDEAIREIRRRISETFQAGRYTRVRLSFRGQRIGPDIPLAVFLAGEGAAFWLLSPLPALLVNLGARAVLDVTFVHEADELVRDGIAAYLDGDLDTAEARYRGALKRRHDDPSAAYNLGVLLGVRGKEPEAKEMFRRASMGPPGHPDVVRAAEALARLERGAGRGHP